MTDDKSKWRWTRPGEEVEWEQSLGRLVIEPAVDFVVRTGEIILLAGAFYAAAQLSNNRILHLFSDLMFFALALHFGMAWGRYVLLPLQKVKLKATWQNLLIIAVPGVAIGLLWFWLWQQIIAATKMVVAYA